MLASAAERARTLFHNEIVGKSSLTWMHFVVSPADGGLRKVERPAGSFTLASELLERKNIWERRKES